MALVLTIPDVVESEPLTSVWAAPDGVTFTVTLGVGDTLVRLMRIREQGEHVPLVVLTFETEILALDSVYVSDVSLDGERAAHVTLAAQAVRVV